MTTPSENLKGRLKGVGVSLSASPPLRELYDEVVRHFEAGETEEQVRLFVSEYLFDHDDRGYPPPRGLNPKPSPSPPVKGLKPPLNAGT